MAVAEDAANQRVQQSQHRFEHIMREHHESMYSELVRDKRLEESEFEHLRQAMQAQALSLESSTYRAIADSRAESFQHHMGFEEARNAEHLDLHAAQRQIAEIASEMQHARQHGHEQRMQQAGASHDRWISTENRARDLVVAGERQLAEQVAKTEAL